jgi:predicted dehydrogenase
MSARSTAKKPIAPTWSDAKKMVEVCAAEGVQLTFNHQRRFNAPFQRAREMLNAGEIGELQSIEAYCFDLFDWGTHWFDMMFFYNGETPAEWVFGQVDLSTPYTIFGLPLERFGISHVGFQNGVRGTLVAGRGDEIWNGLRVRLNGSKGSLEVGEAKQSDKHPLRILNGADGWKPIAVEKTEPGDDAYLKVMPEIIASLQSGGKHPCSTPGMRLPPRNSFSRPTNRRVDGSGFPCRSKASRDTPCWICFERKTLSPKGP